MKIFQKPAVIDKSSSILRVNNDTFAELVGQSEDFFNFNFSFNISLSNPRKNAKDYEKVLITVKRKETEDISSSTIFSNVTSIATDKKINVASSLKVNKFSIGNSNTPLPDKVSNKLYSGLQLIKDIEKTEQFIARVSVPISSLVNESADNKYSVTELYAETYKINIKDARVRDTKIRNELVVDEISSTVEDQDTSKINPTSVINRINFDLCDITQPITEDTIKSLTSESLIDGFKIRMSEISKGKPALFFDIAKYYLNDVLPSPIEETSIWYSKRNSTKTLDDLEISQQVTIKKGNKNLNLTVRFDLYKIGSNLIDESYTTDLYMPSHVEAFECISSPPNLKISNHYTAYGVSKKLINTLSIIDTEKSGKIQSYNIYLKSVDEQGTVSPYVKIGSVKNQKFNEFEFFASSKLSIVRVIPVDSQSKESNIFTNIVVGPGYKSIGNLAILPSHFGKNQIKIDILNIPVDCISLTLYRRDCTDNSESYFEAIETIKLNNSGISSVLTDETTEIDRTYEYYVVAIALSQEIKEEKSVFSNYAVFKNTRGSFSEGSINVKLSNPLLALSGDSYEVTFNLSTSISKSENEKITQTLKEQLGEIYDQYLNPATNTSSPLGEDQKGIPQYSNIFFHEIVRTNLNTSERETFELVSDGVFRDNQETQIISNIKSINPQHSYVYQVFTYKKNPIEIFKKFVARGVDSKGREWFYLPYKWKQPVVKLGKLYADDSQGVPVVDAYDNFTSESFGLTAQYQTDGSAQYASISQVNFDRVDINTMKLSWAFEDNSTDLFDSFVVMKVVNGVRGFVGRTCKNYIYHELTDSDIGSLYYIIVPIMSEFDIDSPGYSGVAYVSPEGLTPRIKSASFSSNLSNNLSSKSKDVLFNKTKNTALLSSLVQNKTIKKF